MDKATGENDDDLMAMLEESQNDFSKNKEETKQEDEDVMEELQKTEKLDKEVSEQQEAPQTMQNDFMKGFEEMAKNLPGAEGGKLNVSSDEMKDAMNMFQNMFSFTPEGEGQSAEDVAKSAEGGANPAAPTSGNPFLAGYNNMAKDAKSAGEGGMPNMGDLGEMFKDEEFKNFFSNFTQGMFKPGEDGMDPSKMFEGMGTGNPDEMMENMMKEMGGYLEENKDDPQIKNTIDEMMSSLVEKDSIYPSMKVMRDEFPEYLEKNEEKLSPQDLERYNEQLDWLEELCEMYEKEDQPNKDDVANLLFKLQTFGSPPDELVQKMRETWTGNIPGMGALGGLGGMGFPGMGGK